MSAALRLQVNWTIIDCCTCGTIFAVPREVNDRWEEDSRKWFYCPNGHRQHYSEGDLQREHRLREKAEYQLRLAKKQAEWSRTEAEHQRRSAAAYRGHLTRARKRIANGVCPCCNRTFDNVRRHMRSKHPEFLAKVDGEKQ